MDNPALTPNRNRPGSSKPPTNSADQAKEKGLRHKLASYIGKYITKDFAEHALNEKRYWTSRGISIPELHSIAHLLSDDPAEAIKTAFDAALRVGSSLDRCQAYWNQELGCFWLSTREM